jgi:hypothetical protein
VSLSGEEKAALPLSLRADRIRCAGGQSIGAVAGVLHAIKQMACKGRGRFLQRRLDGCWTSHGPARPGVSATVRSQPW